MSAEKLYEAVKSGKIKVKDLNDAGKKLLKPYLESRVAQQTSASSSESLAKEKLSIIKTQKERTPSINKPDVEPVNSGSSRKLSDMTVENMGFPQTYQPKPQPQLVAKTESNSRPPNYLEQQQLNEIDGKWHDLSLPGRDVPVVGEVLRGLDSFGRTKLQNTIADVGLSVYTPGAGLANVTGFTGGVGGKLAQVAPKLDDLKIGKVGVGKIATEAIKEGAVGAPVGFMQSLAQDNDLGTALKHGAYGAGLGALGGTVGGAIASKTGVKTVTPKTENTKQDWFTNLFGDQGVGIVSGGGKAKEMIDTHIVNRAKKPNSLLETASEKTDTIKQELVDKFSPFNEVSKDAYNAAMDSTRANNLANVTIKDKFVDLEGNVRGKSLKEVYATVPRGQKDLADRYTIMRDAASRMDRNIKVYGDEPWFPKTSDDAERMYKELEERNPWLKQFGQDWNDFNRNRQDLWVESGIASQELIETLRHTNPNYAPMFRQQDKGSLKQKLAINSSKSGFSGQKAPIKRAVGSTKKIIDPAQGMIETTGSSYNAMMRNRAMQKVYDAVLSDPEKYKGIIEVVEETADMKQATIKAINEAVEENGLEGIADLLNNELNGIFNKSTQSANKNDAIVTVMRNGEPVKMRVTDPSLLKAIEGISPEQLGAITKVFNTISRGIKYAATGGLAPLQGLKLAVRDLPIAFAQSKDKKMFLFDVGRAFISQAADWLPDYVPGAERLGKMARNYYRAGGGYEAYLKGDSKLRTMSADLTKDPILSGRNLVKTARKANPFRPLAGFGNGLENVPRIAAFNAVMRESGWKRDPETVRRAIEAGRDATVNWSRRGAKGAEIESYLPYSNAAVQGTYRLVQRFKEQPVSAIALIMSIAGAKIAAYEKFKNDKDYQQRSKFEKGIPVSKTSDGKFVTVPAEPTEAFIADQVFNFYKWAMDGESGQGVKQTVQEGAEALLPKYVSGPVSAFTSPGKEIDAKSALSTTVGGSAFEPIMASVAGQNFYGGDVVPREYQGLSTDLQHNETTSVAGKWVAENLGIDAFTFDYLAQKFGGDVAKIGLPMTSEVGKGDPMGNILDEALSKLKMLEDPVMKNRIADDYYNYADVVTEAKQAFTHKDIPLPSWYQRAYDEVTSQKKDSLATRISDLNTMKKEVQRNPSLGAKQRADQLRAIQSQINLLRIQGIKRLEELGVPIAKGR